MRKLSTGVLSVEKIDSGYIIRINNNVTVTLSKYDAIELAQILQELSE